MNFDFGKFASVGVEVENAFGEVKTEEVLASIANEIQSNDTEEKKEEDLASLSDEQVKKNLEFLKEQKEKAKSKEDAKKVEDKEETKEENKNKVKAKKDTKPKQKSEKKEEEPVVYSRPRNVIAYGELVYEEVNVNATLDDIRKTLVEQYGYSEFKNKDKCEMRFDAKTGEVYPHIQFNKKG